MATLARVLLAPIVERGGFHRAGSGVTQVRTPVCVRGSGRAPGQPEDLGEERLHVVALGFSE
jgi:hypothetical protein